MNNKVREYRTCINLIEGREEEKEARNSDYKSRQEDEVQNKNKIR